MGHLVHAARLWRKNAAVWAGATLAVAIGLAVTTALAGVVDAIFWRALPFKNPESLVAVSRSDPRSIGLGPGPVSPGMLRELHDHQSVIEDVAGIGPGDFRVEPGEVDDLGVQHLTVSWNFFDLVGARPWNGRTFVQSDAHAAQPVPAVIGYGLWRSRFGAHRDTLGRTVTLGRRSFVIVGVMPPGFEFPWETNLWTPLFIPPERESFAFLFGIARLRPGHTPVGAMQSVAATKSASIEGGRASGWSIELRSLRDTVQPRSALWLSFLGVTSFMVLCAAWVQLGSLQVILATDRAREMAICVALGASWRSLVTQLVFEATLLAVVALTAAWALVAPATRWISTVLPARAMLTPTVLLDARLFVYASTITIIGLAALVFVVLGRVRRLSVVDLLNGRISSQTSGRRDRLRAMLVLAQISITVGLLYCTALFARSYAKASNADLGFQPANLLVIEPRFDQSRLRNRPGMMHLTSLLLDSIRRHPTVEAAAASNVRPFRTGGLMVPTRLADESEQREQLVRLATVTPGYLDALRSQILAGRDFSEADTADSTPVAIVNETMARRVVRADAVGRAIRVFGRDRTVIGVVKDMKDTAADEVPRPQVYVPAAQGNPTTVLVIRGSEITSQLIKDVRGIVAGAGQDLEPVKVVAVSDAVNDSMSEHRARSSLLGALTLSTLLLTALGLFGALANAIRQRRHEFAVRIAVGATARSIGALVARYLGVLLGLGAALGLAAGLAVGAFLSGILFEIRSPDLVSAGIAVSGLAVAALVVAARPTVRASLTSPLSILRDP